MSLGCEGGTSSLTALRKTENTPDTGALHVQSAIRAPVLGIKHQHQTTGVKSCSVLSAEIQGLILQAALRVYGVKEKDGNRNRSRKRLRFQVPVTRTTIMSESDRPEVLTINGKLQRPVRALLFGGGYNKNGTLAFIAKHHDDALSHRHRGQIVAGALNDDSIEWANCAAGFYGIDPARAYTSAGLCLERELGNADVGIICTRNRYHFGVAKALLMAGKSVVCEKPITMTVAEALELHQLVSQANGKVALMVPHVYRMSPMAVLAREMIENGETGPVRAVRAVYIQGWEDRKMTIEECPQTWRNDSKEGGVGGATGDIKTHVFDFVRNVAGVRPLNLCSVLQQHVQGRDNDDYGVTLIRCDGGVLVTLTASQITTSRQNHIIAEIDCENCSIVFDSELADRLVVRRHGLPDETYMDTPDADWAKKYPKFRASCYWPGGHGNRDLHHWWCNAYGLWLDDVVRILLGETIDPFKTPYPNIGDGIWGMRLIHGAVGSNSCWVDFPAE